jgi:hypothetical protein
MDDEDKGESWGEALKTIVIFVVVILAITLLVSLFAKEPSTKIPTDDELYQDWIEQNYTPRYDEP